MTEITPVNDKTEQQGNRWLLIIGGVLLIVSLSVGITLWVINHYIFPKQFDPVILSQKETKKLDKKLEQFGWVGQSKSSSVAKNKQLEPEKYSEQGAKREVSLSERELNALLAKNTDLADKLVIDLSEGLASGKLLVPMDEDFPILGGKTLKITAGIVLDYANQRPVIKLRGVSIMGVPIPNSWLGGMKNVDLINEFGQDAGFWKDFSKGIEHINVSDGKLTIKLKE